MIGRLLSFLLKVVFYLAALGELVEITELMRREAFHASRGGLISLRALNAGLVGPRK